MLFSQQKIPLGVRSVRNVSFLSTLWQEKEAGIRRGKIPFCCFSPPYQPRCPRQELCLLALEGCPQTKYTHVADNTYAPGIVV